MVKSMRRAQEDGTDRAEEKETTTEIWGNWVCRRKRDKADIYSHILFRSTEKRRSSFGYKQVQILTTWRGFFSFLFDMMFSLITSCVRSVGTIVQNYDAFTEHSKNFVNTQTHWDVCDDTTGWGQGWKCNFGPPPTLDTVYRVSYK